MKRRLLTILLPVTAATLAAGCTTFTDNDAIARVGSVELSADGLDEQLIELGAQPELLDGLTDANVFRQGIAAWLDAQVTEVRTDRSDASRAAEVYPKGLTESGSACVQIIVTASSADAADALARLRDGDDFDAVFATSNIDPTLVDNSGSIGCLGARELPLNTGNALVDSLTEISESEPYASALAPGGEGQPDAYIVTRFVPYDELGPDDTPIVVQNLSAEALGVDIYVDPQFGTYDPASATVIPLG